MKNDMPTLGRPIKLNDVDELIESLHSLNIAWQKLAGNLASRYFMSLINVIIMTILLNFNSNLL